MASVGHWSIYRMQQLDDLLLEDFHATLGTSAPESYSFWNFFFFAETLIYTDDSRERTITWASLLLFALLLLLIWLLVSIESSNYTYFFHIDAIHPVALFPATSGSGCIFHTQLLLERESHFFPSWTRVRLTPCPTLTFNQSKTPAPRRIPRPIVISHPN